MYTRLSSLGLLFLVAITLNAADYKAGLARLIITPEKPMYVSGYANGTHASEGKVHDLWAKALAIEDRKGGRLVIVSTDLVGLPRATDLVATRVLRPRSGQSRLWERRRRLRYESPEAGRPDRS